VGGAQCYVDTGYIGYVSLYFASPHSPSVNSPALLDASFRPAEAVAGGSCWVLDELLIGNERLVISLPRVPIPFYLAGS